MTHLERLVEERDFYKHCATLARLMFGLRFEPNEGNGYLAYQVVEGWSRDHPAYAPLRRFLSEQSPEDARDWMEANRERFSDEVAE